MEEVLNYIKKTTEEIKEMHEFKKELEARVNKIEREREELTAKPIYEKSLEEFVRQNNLSDYASKFHMEISELNSQLSSKEGNLRSNLTGVDLKVTKAIINTPKVKDLANQYVEAYMGTRNRQFTDPYREEKAAYEAAFDEEKEKIINILLDFYNSIGRGRTGFFYEYEKKIKPLDASQISLWNII